MQDIRIDLLQRMPIFGGIREDVLQYLLSVCPVVSVVSGAFFFREGEQGDAMFVLERGTVSVQKSWQGQDIVLQTLGGGDCFGEMALMDMSARSASIQAIGDCSAIRISAADLYRLYSRDLKQFTLIQMNMGREVSRRLRQMDHQLFLARMAAEGPASQPETRNHN